MTPSYSIIDKDKVFFNKEVDLSQLHVYGFDYDYTLVNYTDALSNYIFQEAIRMLVSNWKVLLCLRISICFDLVWHVLATY